MRNSITNCDIETNDLAWIQKMVAGPENIDGLDWVDEDELTGEEITDIRQLEAFGVTDQSLKIRSCCHQEIILRVRKRF